eukprot:TRINITY_DN14072_c0_g1_i1.p1 TRINITY_DN14072_c0_g1~~TRINITY_DN14072_c0_g1_i1.p1  ORF type:complete len:492 (+),score=53.34 TRINITY_DN14072_c0_g1_i1:242-1717(+)
MVLDWRRALPVVLSVLCLVMGKAACWWHLGEALSAHTLFLCGNLQSIRPALDRHPHRVRCILIIAALLVAAIWVVVDGLASPLRLMSAGGLFVFVMLCYVLSRHRRRVKFRPVLWGLGLQLVLGFFVIRTRAGFLFFEKIGSMVSAFLDFSDAGAAFVFGDNFRDVYFAFKVLPTICFFSTFMSVCYYFGIVQVVVRVLSKILQRTMGTAASESLSAAGNIFVGQTEAPLLVRPFVPDMTLSELHAVMTGGFATIAGGVLAAYINLGISPAHLIGASVMSAPAALAISKLVYPETETSVTAAGTEVDIPPGDERNVLEAAANGARTSISLMANVAVMLIAFISLLAFIDSVLGYFGSLVDHPSLSFAEIASIVCAPFALILGVSPEDVFEVAKLLGKKTLVNEFVAYADLSQLIKNRQNGIRPYISERSEAIVTYALCGFANVSSLGVQVGGLSVLAPGRVSDLSSLAVSAMLSGTVACFMTACIAGMFIE